MQDLFKRLRDAMRDLVRREPRMRFGGGNADWIAPVLGPGPLSATHYLGRCYRDSTWYFERPDYPEGR
ncbi:MAG TPA: hypothetical protein VMW18_19380 [Candidatus Binatia bacterium]|nr:hypothetical protein [Candidatus Binatia bacterium]